MPAVQPISDDDIAHAERALLPLGKSFDPEQRHFIRRLDTLDLHAVPGSGKTTALLAKLFILDRMMPFRHGSGVLVLSHTNAAIDEIKHRLGPFCASLFEYPNYVGTIQGFVDRFLAIPYYATKSGKQPVRIDNALYSEQMRAYPRFRPSGFTDTERNRALGFLHAQRDLCTQYRFHLDQSETVLARDVKGSPLNIRPRGSQTWSAAEVGKVAEWLKAFKKHVMARGYLCFDDAYFLANVYIRQQPHIKLLLRDRFKYVFVDEMQDMAQHQHDILENIFAAVGGVSDCYQRIGDRNQAIHDQHREEEGCYWTPRAANLSLKRSMRLSPSIAKAVAPFALYREADFSIDGLGTSTLPPTIIAYSDTTIDRVVQTFSSLIQTAHIQGALPPLDECDFKAIGWVTKASTEEEPDGKRRLIDYWPSFQRASSTKRIEHPSLKGHVLAVSNNGQSMHAITDSLTRGLLKVLRLEGISDPRTGANFRTGTFWSYLEENYPSFHEQIRTSLYEWSAACLTGQSQSAIVGLRACIPDLLACYSKSLSKASDFVTNDDEALIAVVPIETNSNIANYDGFDIHLTTVHGVKGQTHTATLYMETAYQSDGPAGRKRHYESQRLATAFGGEVLTGNLGVYIKKSARMAYVGLSRPTHLLCVAVHESNVRDYLPNIETAGWRLVQADVADIA